jgi:hypothetical protein
MLFFLYGNQEEKLKKLLVDGSRVMPPVAITEARNPILD